MRFHNKFIKLKIIALLSFVSFSATLADNHNIYETLEKLQKDIKTLERAVYSNFNEENQNNTKLIFKTS